jgi:glyoxylase-like metal-dependent hydrolase (beta-lactamase superfamily II)
MVNFIPYVFYRRIDCGIINPLPVIDIIGIICNISQNSLNAKSKIMNFSDILIETIVSTPFQENCYLVRSNNSTDCFLVDPGLEPEKIVAVLKRDALTPVALLITHGHADHIGGINKLREKWADCKIYIGEQDADKLTDAEKNLSDFAGVSLTFPTADFLLQDGETLEIAGISLEVRHCPGHAAGHVLYVVQSEPKKILFVGDAIFRGSIGRSDFPDGDPQIQIKMIEQKILTLPDDTIIYSGHGEPTTVGTERRTNPFL